MADAACEVPGETRRVPLPRSVVLMLAREVMREVPDTESALRLLLDRIGARAAPDGDSRAAVAAMVASYELAVAAVAAGGRALRGVFHTPMELARCVARSALTAVEESFGLARGLSDPRLLFIDPAAGTGVFFAALLSELPQGAAPPRLLGLELCPVATALAGRRLAELCPGDALREKLELRCADALAATTLGASSDDIPIIIGNPPYRGHSANPSSPVRALLADYRVLDGEPLAERNIKWLQDDYVKFFRLAQATAQRAPQAVIAFVTNHAWLDNPTFRGMRHSLLADFAEVRVLDLGGNRLRQADSARASTKDENVFAISQGVAITLLIRGGRRGVRRHGALLGTRAQKLARLSGATVQSLTRTRLAPAAPAYELTPRQHGLGDEFRRGRSISELFGVQGPGIVTGRDALVTDVSHDALMRRIEVLKKGELADAELPVLRERRDWSLESASAALRADLTTPQLVRYLYRPFHHRYACLHPALIERGRRQVMSHLEGRGALALVAMRQVASGAPYSHLLVTDCPVDNRVFYSNRGIVTVLPLWLNPGTSEQRCNLNDDLLAHCRQLRGTEVTPLQVFDAIYASLLAPGYRARYAECLALEFPRVHLPESAVHFEKLITIGRQLRELHLGEGETPRPQGTAHTLPWIGGYSPERILAMANDPDRTRAVLTETQELFESL